MDIPVNSLFDGLVERVREEIPPRQQDIPESTISSHANR